MLDRYNRHINYLRISVTDRCNLRCRYCMPEEGVKLIRHEDILTYDEITAFTRIAVASGITKVRITGGEPLVRKGVAELVRMIAAIEGVTDLSMTTNGILLAGNARALAEAGLMRVNVSLDTLDPVKYRYVTRGGDLYSVLNGVEAARKAGLRPVKINCVIKSTPDETDAREVAEYCMREGLEVRFIRQMDLATGTFSVVHGGSGGSLATSLQHAWSLPTALAFLAWYVYAPQCLASIAVARRETNSRGWTALMVIYLFVLAYIAAALTYWIARAAGL